MRRSFASFTGWIAAATVAGIMATSAVAEPLNMRFDVYVSGLRVMKVKFDGELKADSYSGSASMRPKGFGGLFVKNRLDMRVQGRFNDAHARPVSFWLKSRKKKKEREATLRWTKGASTPEWSRKPPVSDAARREIDAAIANGAIDPLSLLFAIGRRQAANPCTGKVRIFDGRTVFDLRLASVGRDAIRNMNYSGPALKCRLVYVPVAGMSEKKKRKRLKNPPVFTVWLARVHSAAGPVHVPVQASGRMKGRPFTATLSDALLGGKPLRAAR